MQTQGNIVVVHFNAIFNNGKHKEATMFRIEQVLYFKHMLPDNGKPLGPQCGALQCGFQN